MKLDNSVIRMAPRDWCGTLLAVVVAGVGVTCWIHSLGMTSQVKQMLNEMGYTDAFFQRMQKVNEFFSQLQLLNNMDDPDVICSSKSESQCILTLDPKIPSHAEKILSFGNGDSCSKNYRTLVTKWHPDKCKLQECAEILGKIVKSAATAGCKRK